RSGDHDSRVAASDCAADAEARRRCGRVHARLHSTYAEADGDGKRAVEYVRFRRQQRVFTFQEGLMSFRASARKLGGLGGALMLIRAMHAAHPPSSLPFAPLRVGMTKAS